MNAQLRFTFDTIRDHESFLELSPEIVEKFWKYHTDNPQIYDLFLKFARQAKASGRRKYSAQAICERIRWHLEVETRGDEFKINNNYRACYARLIMLADESLKGFFETRRKGEWISG